MQRKYTMRSKEEKLAIVKRNLAGEGIRQLEQEAGIHNEQIQRWTAIIPYFLLSLIVKFFSV